MNELTLIDKLATFTNVDTSQTTYLTHGIHPYPAKYIPQLPREIILANTTQRSTILDPFCGSGTTLLEACLNGRKSIGIDSNPIAALIASAKTHALNNDELDRIDIIIEELAKIDLNNIRAYDIPNAKNLNHWFTESVIIELSWLKNYIYNNSDGNLRNFLLCIFSSIIVNVSNQESDTRYAAKVKNINKGGVILRFLRKLNSEYINIIELSKNKNAIRNTPQIYNIDSRKVDSSIIKDNSVDLVITSPPYPNSYDYYLYHKWRMIWLGFNVNDVRDKEVGSRHEHSSRKASIEVFEEKMIPILTNVSRVLKPNKLAYFFMGDSIISGEFIDMSESFKKIAQESGLKYVNGTKYDLDSVTRYFYEKRTSSNKNKYVKKQHILVFEPSKDKKFYIDRNLNSLQVESEIAITQVEETIAKPKSEYKPIILGKDEVKNNSIISIVDSNENNPIHSLGKYPAKFIPEIPRWAIEKFSKEGDLVLDPFNGSGTTVTEALILGRNAVGIDISPYSCLLTKSKTTIIDEIELDISVTKLITLMEDTSKYPKVFRKKFKNDDFWFSTRHLDEVEIIKFLIKNNFNEKVQKFFLGVI